MARLGDLERSVMDVLWDTDDWLTAREVASRLDHERDLAYTTVLTVLERLERKGFVQRQRAARAHRYQASSSRDAVVAEAMLAVLDTTEDRSSALIRFVGSVSPAEAEILRRALTPPAGAPGGLPGGDVFGGTDQGDAGKPGPHGPTGADNDSGLDDSGSGDTGFGSGHESLDRNQEDPPEGRQVRNVGSGTVRAPTEQRFPNRGTVHQL